MDDDEIFRRSMVSIGVEPLKDGARRPAAECADDAAVQQGQEQGQDEDERRLFLEALGELDAGGREPPPEPPPELPRGAGKPGSRLRRKEKNPRIEQQIDLHRLKAADALTRLEHFLTRVAASRARAVLVITGKGHHSPEGRGILRQRVEQWLQGPGRRHVRAFSEAPRKLGGRGAFVVYLR